MVRLSIFVGIAFFMFSTLAKAETYTVKRGDTLASIARAHFGEPVFGPKGTLKKLLRLNPGLNTKTPLEPGQTVELSRQKEPRNVHESKGDVTVVAPVPPVVESSEASMNPAARTEETAKMNEPVESAAAPAEPKVHEPANEPEASAAHKEKGLAAEEHSTHEGHSPHPEHAETEVETPHNYFTIIPSYSMVMQKATDVASGASFTANSNSAYGVELGWDHWWSESFSTVLTYAVNHLESKETSAATGEKVFNKVSLNTAELALLNRVTHWMRVGFGAAYGDHLFIENFAATPADPQGYIITFLNPFLAAEITLSESHRFEWLANVKIAALPAQVGFGHDVSAGTEYFAQLGCLQKFSRMAMFYALSYSTENQTRTDATETRSESALHVGLFF